MVKKERQAELHDASIPWALLRQSQTWTEILKVENIYSLSKQANF